MSIGTKTKSDYNRYLIVFVVVYFNNVFVQRRYESRLKAVEEKKKVVAEISDRRGLRHQVSRLELLCLLVLLIVIRHKL